MIATKMGALLNVAQRGRIVTMLRSLELDLVQARAALEAPPEQGILYRSALNLPDERRTAILAEIEAALQEIAGLAHDLALPVTDQDVASKIAARLSVDWADLIDSTSAALRRYGDVDPRLADILDERVERLSTRASTLASLYRGEGSR